MRMATVIKSAPITGDIHIMKDGDVAEILKWHDPDVSIGSVIQRYGNSVVLIGEGHGKGYPNIFECDSKVLSKIEVKILPKGSTIVL